MWNLSIHSLYAAMFFALTTWASADMTYNDGETHLLSTDIGLNGYVYDDALGNATTVNIETGGVVTQHFSAYDDSQILLNGGNIDYDYLGYDNSFITATSGSVGHNLYLYNNAFADISDINIGGWLGALDDSKITLSGGNIDLVLISQGHIDMYGGVVGGTIWASSGDIIIYGTDFNMPYGTVMLNEGLITGILENGDTMYNLFEISSGGSITLVESISVDPAIVPTPSALILGTIGLGMAGWLKRKRMACLQP